jgi:hypothetical protein
VHLLPQGHDAGTKGMGTQQELECTLELRRDLVEQYFAHIHDKHHSLFHQPTIMQQLEEQMLPEVLLYAMMALGARFSDRHELIAVKPRRRGREYAKIAVSKLDMADISITTVQASILLGTIAFAESRMESEAMYYSVATRLALLLKLHNRSAVSAIEHQVNLRVWWTLYMIDIWSATGLHLPRQFGYSEQVPLPAEESVFLLLPDSPPSTSIFSSSASIWGVMAHLAHIWTEIHEVNKASVAGLSSPSELNASVATLSAKLQDWSASLPRHLICTEANLVRYSQLNMGSAFAALHLGYHYYNEVLFYQFLSPHTRPDPAISTAHFATSCKLHARQFCDLLYLCNSSPNCAPLYVMVGHMLVVTSTVYMHDLLFSASEEDITEARRRLEHNFEILTRLQSFWVELDVSLKRLQAFHNACRISSEQSFRLDRWMLTFLLEHGVPVTEKFVVTDDAHLNEHSPPAETPLNVAIVVEGISNASDSPNLTLQDWYQQTFPA